MGSELEIGMSVAQLNVILQALGKQPAEMSMELIIYLRNQAELQLKPKEEGA